MSEEYLQFEQQVNDLDEALSNNPFNLHLLLQTAYMSDKKRWMGSLSQIEDNIKEAEDKKDSLEESQKDPKFLTNLWNKITSKDKLVQQNVEALSEEIEHLKETHQRISESPPNKDRYSLAFMGSTIFSPK